MAIGKCSSKIRNIVQLRQMLRCWKRRAAAAAAARSSRPPADVPAGYVAVCVGTKYRRYVVRAAHLNHPLFRRLLAQCEEEFGFSACSGPLALPCCDVALFEEILRHISSSSARFANLEGIQKCCCCHMGGAWHPESLPLLRGLAEKPVW